jgi:transcriptional regulator GlxA family with amidase domain
MPDVTPISKANGKGLAGWQADLVLRLLGNPSGDIPVAALARSCGLSRSYFIRAFKRSMGLPPHHWVMHRRIERAREMLVRTNESIAEIAINCGFADQSHLTRVFHNVVGESPAAWRRRRKAQTADHSARCQSQDRKYGDAAATVLPED